MSASEVLIREAMAAAMPDRLPDHREELNPARQSIRVLPRPMTYATTLL